MVSRFDHDFCTRFACAHGTVRHADWARFSKELNCHDGPPFVVAGHARRRKYVVLASSREQKILSRIHNRMLGAIFSLIRWGTLRGSKINDPDFGRALALAIKRCLTRRGFILFPTASAVPRECEEGACRECEPDRVPISVGSRICRGDEMDRIHSEQANRTDQQRRRNGGSICRSLAGASDRAQPGGG